MSETHRERQAPATIRLLLGLGLCVSACVGDIDGPLGAIGSERADGQPGPSEGGDQTPDDLGPLSPDTPSKADPNVAGVRPLRRLNELEYNLTLRSLLRDPNLAFQDLGGDPQGDHGFALPGIDVPNQRLLDITETLSAKAVENLPLLYDCDLASESEEVCAGRFIEQVGRRAYRRPVEAEERDALLSLYSEVRAQPGFDFKESVRITLEAMLLSPRFLYHWQLGGEKPQLEGQAVRLNDYELASRLSYFLWSDMPDDALLDAADRAELGDDQTLSSQIDRMLADPRSQGTVQTFHAQWLLLDSVLGLSKDTTLFPEWNDDLKAAMLAETEAFLADAFGKASTPLEVLFGAPYTFVNETSARLYGIDGVQGAELRKVSLDGRTRAGLLTQPALLAAQANPGSTNPARAGKMIFTDLLCQQMSPPPPGATDAFKLDPALTMRENFETLETKPACKGCHALINPPGFAFEQYDAIGRVRDQDGAAQVDASGALTSRAGEIEFENLADLSRSLSTTPELRECVTRKWLHFALGRVATKADRYSLDQAFQAFHQANYDVKALLKALSLSRTFRYRAPEAGEVM